MYSAWSHTLRPLPLGPVSFAGNASDSDGGGQRADLLGIGYGSDGVGSEGAAAAAKDVKRDAVRVHAPLSLPCPCTLWLCLDTGLWPPRWLVSCWRVVDTRVSIDAECILEDRLQSRRGVNMHHLAPHFVT